MVGGTADELQLARTKQLITQASVVLVGRSRKLESMLCLSEFLGVRPGISILRQHFDSLRDFRAGTLSVKVLQSA